MATLKMRIQPLRGTGRQNINLKCWRCQVILASVNPGELLNGVPIALLQSTQATSGTLSFGGAAGHTNDLDLDLVFILDNGVYTLLVETWEP